MSFVLTAASEKCYENGKLGVIHQVNPLVSQVKGTWIKFSFRYPFLFGLSILLLTCVMFQDIFPFAQDISL